MCKGSFPFFFLRSQCRDDEHNREW
jgi:hypothetical protein